MEKEVWKTLKAPFTEYKISNLGQLKYHNELVKGTVIKNGTKVHLRAGSHDYHPTIHKLVAKYFVPNKENKHFVRHINGNILDDRASNLMWTNYSYPERYGGGKAHKYTRQDDEMIMSKKYPLKTLADKFGVSMKSLNARRHQLEEKYGKTIILPKLRHNWTDEEDKMIFEMTNTQAAKKLGVSVASINSRRQYVRKKMAK